jgi:predicted RND superfamily exporter protein
LIPNLLPLIITAGMMGFAGIPLKPSTVLVFSIAFGISVDDTIHFLAKYRQELISTKWNIDKAVFAALRETGISMFYTSVVLFFGFSVFLSSNFGGTKALGGLVAVTLLMAMLANLILLPSLLISLKDTISNDKVIKKPKIQILDEV